MSAELNTNKPKIKWYLHPASIVIAIFVTGPIAIPLVWMSPSLNRWHKIAVTIIITLLTIWMIMASITTFKILLKEAKNLQAVLN